MGNNRYGRRYKTRLSTMAEFSMLSQHGFELTLNSDDDQLPSTIMDKFMQGIVGNI
ncbi:MAG: hypothetical protein ACTS73_01285 [Arsenophonus sp. NEOnobi-MAG3]